MTLFNRISSLFIVFHVLHGFLNRQDQVLLVHTAGSLGVEIDASPSGQDTARIGFSMMYTMCADNDTVGAEGRHCMLITMKLLGIHYAFMLPRWMLTLSLSFLTRLHRDCVWAGS